MPQTIYTLQVIETQAARSSPRVLSTSFKQSSLYIFQIDQTVQGELHDLRFKITKHSEASPTPHAIESHALPELAYEKQSRLQSNGREVYLKSNGMQTNSFPLLSRLFEVST